MSCKRRYTQEQAFKALGRIDKAHESGRISKRQHDIRSKKVLSRLVKK